MRPDSPSSDRVPSIRIVLVDDHTIVLLGLQKLIESAAPAMSVEAVATCGEHALTAVREHRPDIVLLDLELGQESGFDLLAPMRELGARVIVLSDALDPEAAQTAMCAGASGLIHKSQPAEVILKAIECVHNGELWLDRGTTARVFESFLAENGKPGNEYGALTAAERKIIGAVAEYRSLPNKRIAAALCISIHTLRNHLASIYKKLGVHRRFELVLYAMEHGLVKSGRPGDRRVA